ncbi:MAG TPA: DUF5522 domain-containing protein [Chitinophagaceae bacterium]|nr:hypothetical protein [Chitinophagaceae bacterium]HMZ46853.1 DUF5522 domain-containing protein [Chitinophagaceae bacterium]HNF30294.1 DUF5522 domain-containing protein [Chitinophagaceae bacterium]HNJ58862.1 DUF5522 domain-containing protein [Chitinophagaceae bacterium]HNM33598.1 DUF5522 domain-containing protein [Chitinophagaceae bacterium]
MSSKMIEGEDFYWENGLMVLTEKFHLSKGYCCGNGCKHCPYHYESVPEPKRTDLITLQKTSKSNPSKP